VQVLLACKPLLVEIAQTVKWVGYVSSTGVYGDYQGDWVDERQADAGSLFHLHALPTTAAAARVVMFNHCGSGCATFWYPMWHRSETRADSGKNLARLKAEQAWMALQRDNGLPLHIFRLGGLPAGDTCKGCFSVRC